MQGISDRQTVIRYPTEQFKLPKSLGYIPDELLTSIEYVIYNDGCDGFLNNEEVQSQNGVLSLQVVVI